ncbi:hypothetical protein Tco_1534094 [Tanacetum coccineum]
MIRHFNVFKRLLLNVRDLHDAILEKRNSESLFVARASNFSIKMACSRLMLLPPVETTFFGLGSFWDSLEKSSLRRTLSLRILKASFGVTNLKKIDYMSVRIRLDSPIKLIIPNHLHVGTLDMEITGKRELNNSGTRCWSNGPSA